MPRTNRHYLPGKIWHLTHRCHKKEFLLKFRKDRDEWVNWLYEARKRYGLSVAVGSENYTNRVIEELGSRAKDRKPYGKGDQYELRYDGGAYLVHLGGKKGQLSAKNAYYLDLSDYFSTL